MGRRAWDIARHLVENVGPRGSTTAGEQAAATFIGQELERSTLTVETQHFRSPESAWRPFAVTNSLAVVATVMAPLNMPLSAFLAAVLMAASLWLALREAALANTFLRLLLPQGNSRNVIGRVPAGDRSRQTLVLVSHLDAHRTPYFHFTRGRQAFLGHLLRGAGAGQIINTLLFLLLAFSGQLWFWWLALPFGILYLVVVVICWQADLTPYSPGANDNAAAVGVALALAEILVRQPLLHTDVWFLFSGCEEVGCYGMRAFLEKYRLALRGARFIDLEMVGRGSPGIVVSEGLIVRQRYDAHLIKLAAQSASATWSEPLFKRASAYGESVVSQAVGYSSVTLNTLLPESGQSAAWHRPDDDMRIIDAETQGRVAEWTLHLLHQLDVEAGLSSRQFAPLPENAPDNR